MSRARRVMLACLGAFSVCVGRDARAEVVWHGADCAAPTPSRAASPEGQEPRVDVDVVQHEAGWAATLTARYPSGATGSRHIEGGSCAELVRAIAVSLSLLEPADAESTGRRSVPSVAPGNTTAANDVGNTTALMPGVAVELSPAQGERRGSVGTALLASSAGGRFGELGVALSGALWLGRWGGRAEVGARRPLSSISAAHDVSLELTRFAAALEVCGRSGAWMDWGLCAGPRIELVSGLASGPSDPASDRVALPGMGAGSFLRIPIASRWAFSSELQASWALRGAEANVRPWGRVYELPRFGVGLLVGVDWQL